MNEKQKILFKSFFFLVFCSLSFDALASFAHLVHNRFYYIKRLERVVPLLLLHEQKIHILIESLLGFQKIVPFCHPIVKQAVNEICDLYSLDPFKDLWEMFSNYRFIDDILFLEEFIKAVALVSMILVVQDISHESEQAREVVIELLVSHSLWGESLLRLTHASSDYLDAKCHGYNCAAVKAEWEKMFNVYNKQKTAVQQLDQTNQLLLNIDLIAERFYLIQRLDHAVELLHQNKIVSMFQKKLKKQSFFEGQYTHSMIIQVCQKMTKERSLDPLFYLWDFLKGYESIKDPLLVREFAQLIFFFFKESCLYYAKDDLAKEVVTTYEQRLSETFFREQKTALEYIVTLYQVIDRLPLNEILDAIDILARELPLLAQHSEFNLSISWKQWLKKYWWLPPFIVAALAFKFLKRMAYGKISSLFSRPDMPLGSDMGSPIIPVRPSGSHLLRADTDVYH